ncbi:MAG: DUF2191 domain-containing protein [Deltaproteobacteria bacterium]|nr:DUF2191 domain-containing protein [Nannocystaceae bacterium]
MRMSIDLPELLLRRAMALAARRGTTLRELICEGLEAVLSPPAPGKQPFRLADGSFRGEGYADGVDGGDWARLRDLGYEGRGG